MFTLKYWGIYSKVVSKPYQDCIETISHTWSIFSLAAKMIAQNRFNWPNHRHLLHNLPLLWFFLMNESICQPPKIAHIAIMPQVNRKHPLHYRFWLSACQLLFQTEKRIFPRCYHFLGKRWWYPLVCLFGILVTKFLCKFRASIPLAKCQMHLTPPTIIRYK